MIYPSIAASYFHFGICLFLTKRHDTLLVQNKSFLAEKSVFQCRWKAFCFCLAASHPVHLWPMPCASTGPSWSWLQQQPDWRRGNLVGGCGWSVSGKLCEWMDPGWELGSIIIQVMGNLRPDLIGGLIVEPWTFSGLIGFWTFAEAHDFSIVVEDGKGRVILLWKDRS